MSAKIDNPDIESSKDEYQGRRRFVRGVVSVVPVVLTLRSGAAAASCTGVRLITTTNNSNQRMNLPSGFSVNSGDKCVEVAPTGLGTVQSCNTTPPSILTSKANNPVFYDIDSKNKCGTLGGGKNVAILSSNAVTSFK